MKPPTKHTVKPKAIRLKYFSMKSFIDEPYLQSKKARIKKRAPLLIMDERRNINKLISNTPAVTVKILYGIGVNPAVKIIQKSHLVYNNLILLNKSTENPGMLLKNRLANPVKSPLAFTQVKWPTQ